MFSRKQQQRFHYFIVLAVVALVSNIAYPTTARAQGISPDITGSSHTELTNPQPLPKPSADLTSLPQVEDKPVVKRLVVRASAYSSTVDQTDGDPFTTASGTKVHRGTIAMNGLPFGTKIRIPAHYGHTVFTVEDRMHPKWGTKRIDIWMPTRGEAREWGVRSVNIEILS